MTVRPFHTRDREALWKLKRAFELELSGTTGEPAKETAYEAKLTARYKSRYFEWVERCIEAEPRSVMVAEEEDLVGYVFVLPEAYAFIWDAAVLNELYVTPAARGAGISDALMDAALTVARQQSLPMDRLVLDVAPENERAAAFYRRFGFESWGTIVSREL